MPTATGTAASATDLLVKLNTFLTANGWTKIHGETDMAVESPKAARYWRIMALESDDAYAQYWEIEKLEWRTTAGGANVATDNSKYSTSSAGNTTWNLVTGTPLRSQRLYGAAWFVQYDFGSPTIIRELVMKCDTDNEVPAHFYVQWSNDARTWTTMFYQPYDTELYTADNQTVTFSWASGAGYLNPRHPSATVARRGGYSYFTSGGVSSENVYREHCDDIWCWQGPGYDAARRVYVSAIPTYNLTSQYEAIAFTGHIDVDATMLPASWFTNQEGVLPSSLENNSPTHTMSSNGVEYWFYCNSKRFIVVTRSGVDEYGMSYCGFVSAFAQPDDYPFPLYIGSVTDTWSYPLSTAGTYLRDAQDPVSGAAYYRLWDNTWREVYNHDLDLGRSENWSSAPDAVIWPKHIGVVGGSNYPQNWGGDHADPEGHMLSSMDPTEQGDLPVIPSILLDRTYGAIGALDGVFTIPGGSVLSPESTFTIGADTYRVFATRSWSDGVQYYCIREV